jgi:UDPglucose 6-dehydrogenase
MRVAVIGSGYVGLVSGTCFAEFGVQVTCVDKDQSKIQMLNQGQIPIYEPGLSALIERNIEKHLSFTTDLAHAVAHADVVFIAVGTPSRRGDGHADLSYVYAAAEEIAKHLQGYTVIATKSTVPVGTGREVKEIIRTTNPAADFDMVSNPEFLREGSAIEDFMRPDRVVIGCESERAEKVMRQLYRPLYLLETPMVFTTLQTAELIKYAANAFLATKIAFINEMADICEKCDANVQDVAKGIGLDKRIGNKFLHAGPGYGGSCFPKDTLAMVRTAQQFEAPASIVEAVVESNARRKRQMAERVVAACGGSVKGKKIGVLGLTFKPNTDDMRDSPSLEILLVLQDKGALISAFDPQGMKEAQHMLKGITFAKDPYETMDDAEALVIITEWNEFRALDLDEVKKRLKMPVVVDLRNIYPPQEMAEKGFTYLSIGRAPVGKVN